MNVLAVTANDLVCELGEGLHWDAARLCLWGVDIHGRKVWRWVPDTPSVMQWQVDQLVGWVLPVSGDPETILLGLQGGVACVNASTMALNHWCQKPFSDNSGLRLNDAKADATGAVWCGSLNNDDESLPLGCLYRLGACGDWQTVDESYTVANGPAIDATQTVLMHTDSGRRTMYRFDLHAPTGVLSNKQIWKVFAADEGYPDGMCFDSAGAIWVAHWGSGCISQFAPDGCLMQRVILPTSNITNVCFGGPELNRLFVSSARAGLSQQQLVQEPLAGRVFEVIGHGAQGLASWPAAAALGLGR